MRRVTSCPWVFGLTIDCCVLCVAQELFWHGYEPVVLREGVDAPSGWPEDRDVILATTVQNWAKALEWRDLLRSTLRKIESRGATDRSRGRSSAACLLTAADETDITKRRRLDICFASCLAGDDFGCERNRRSRAQCAFAQV